jgi:Zn-dependent protease
VSRRHWQLLAAGLAALLGYLVLRRHVVSSFDVIYFCVLVPSVILHEVSHGVVALGFGDDTAKRAGRITLNPIAHVDILGTIVIPAVMILTGFGAFGWAKPVPVDIRKLRSPRNQAVVVRLVGPMVNVLLALGAALAYRALANPNAASYYTGQSLLVRVVFTLGIVNVILAVFNLIPIPPLDGSAVVERVLPRRWWPGYLRLQTFGLPVLLVIVLLVPSALQHVFVPAIDWWGRLLG